MSEYRYSPLAHANEIRVLTLHAASGSPTISGSIKHIRVPVATEQTPSTNTNGPQTIVGDWMFEYKKTQKKISVIVNKRSKEIEVVEPSFSWSRLPYAAKKYDALSYTWGDPTPFAEMEVNGRSLPVAKNLYRVLLALRNPFAERVLWVDAICINQKDVNERNHQVRLMWNIYSNASSVIVCLGGALGTSHQDEEAAKMIVDINLGGIPKITKYSENAFRGFSHLLSRRWWKRIWIIQEVVAARAVVVLFGYRMVPWSFLERLCNQIRIYEFKETPIKDYLHNCQYRNYQRTSNFRRCRIMPLVDLLHSSRSYEATDPRDKLYALLGMASDVPMEELNPDYNKPVEKVFRDLTIFMARTRRNLDVITSGGLSLSRPGVPSWVPDWNVSEAFRSLNSEEVDGHRYEAAGNTDAVVDLSALPSVIKVEGVIADKVDFFGGAVSIAKGKDMPTLRRWYYLAEQSVSQQELAMFWRTITTDKDHLGKRSSGKFGQLFERFINGYHSVEEGLFADAVTRAVTGRRFFITKNGHMGLGPADIQLKDRVMIVMGCRVPLMTRVVGEHMVLIGEAYVSGMMYGEVIQGLVQGNYRRRTISLK